MIRNVCRYNALVRSWEYKMQETGEDKHTGNEVALIRYVKKIQLLLFKHGAEYKPDIFFALHQAATEIWKPIGAKGNIHTCFISQLR